MQKTNEDVSEAASYTLATSTITISPVLISSILLAKGVAFPTTLLNTGIIFSGACLGVAATGIGALLAINFSVAYVFWEKGEKGLAVGLVGTSMAAILCFAIFGFSNPIGWGCLLLAAVVILVGVGVLCYKDMQKTIEPESKQSRLQDETEINEIKIDRRETIQNELGELKRILTTIMELKRTEPEAAKALLSEQLPLLRAKQKKFEALLGWEDSLVDAIKTVIDATNEYCTDSSGTLSWKYPYLKSGVLMDLVERYLDTKKDDVIKLGGDDSAVQPEPRGEQPEEGQVVVFHSSPSSSSSSSS